MEISPIHLKALKQHAEDVGLDFICTPFSTYAVDVLDEIGVEV